MPPTITAEDTFRQEPDSYLFTTSIPPEPLRLAARPSHTPPVLLSGDSLRLPPDSGAAGSDIAASLRSIWLHSGERLAPAQPDGFGTLRVSGPAGSLAGSELKKAETSAIR